MSKRWASTSQIPRETFSASSSTPVETPGEEGQVCEKGLTFVHEATQIDFRPIITMHHRLRKRIVGGIREEAASYSGQTRSPVLAIVPSLADQVPNPVPKIHHLLGNWAPLSLKKNPETNQDA